jgi:hypothetical protein
MSPELSEKKRERLTEKASRSPELVVIQPLNTFRTPDIEIERYPE